MGKQTTLAQARARCHELGITPGRSIAECERRIEKATHRAEVAERAAKNLKAAAKGSGILEQHRADMALIMAKPGMQTPPSHMRRVRRTETIMGTMTGLQTIVRTVSLVRADR